MSLDLGSASAADFLPLVGQQFSLYAADDVSFPVTLSEVAEGEQGPARRQFALTFAGGPNPPVAQGVMQVQHDHVGALDLFLVPLGPDPASGEQRYEAVFA